MQQEDRRRHPTRVDEGMNGRMKDAINQTRTRIDGAFASDGKVTARLKA